LAAGPRQQPQRGSLLAAVLDGRLPESRSRESLVLCCSSSMPWGMNVTVTFFPFVLAATPCEPSDAPREVALRSQYVMTFI
ncbi:hypothetical protein ACWEPC_51395, partial [Nonomuraea sp. NPDC004297]